MSTKQVVKAPGEAGATDVDKLPPDLLAAWGRQFMHRTRPYARQQLNGSYRWVDAPCDKEVLLAHLAGTQTIALASSDARGWCRWVCLDCDMWDEQSLPQLVQVAATLAERRLPGLVEASRRGGHLWLFLDGLIPAVEARYVVLTALDELQASGTMVPPLDAFLVPVTRTVNV